RQTAVQPEARRLDRAAGKHDDPRFLCQQVTAAANTPGHGASNALLVGSDSHRTSICKERCRFACARPAVRCQRHRHVAHAGSALSFQVDWCRKRLEASLQAVAAESASTRARENEFASICGPPRGSFRLENCVLLRSKCRADNILAVLERQPDQLRT